MRIGTQIESTLIGPSPLEGFTHYKVLTFFKLKK